MPEDLSTCCRTQPGGSLGDLCFLTGYSIAEEQPTAGSQAYWVLWRGISTSLGPRGMHASR